MIDEEEQTFMLSDLSQGGLSFIIPIEQQENFERDKTVIIKRIGSKTFKNEVRAKVVHLSTLSEIIETQMKVGLQYEEAPKLDN